MRFLKEYVILFFIIVFVILIEIITDNITNKSITDINSTIEDLESALESGVAEEKIKNLCSSWKKEEDKLAFYMEHDELEKVGVLVDNIKSDIANDSMDEINEKVDEIKFLLEHVKNKQKIELKNIF
jgi:hypothetical protein